MARAAAPAKPTTPAIVTLALPSRCPSCGWKHLQTEPRAGGWFRVTCLRGNVAICTWAANYEVKATEVATT